MCHICTYRVDVEHSDSQTAADAGRKGVGAGDGERGGGATT